MGGIKMSFFVEEQKEDTDKKRLVEWDDLSWYIKVSVVVGVTQAVLFILGFILGFAGVI
jgi:hypothetical protein